MEIHRAELFTTNALFHSLSTIQAAKTRFHLLTASNSTTTVLVSQIRLCDVLLEEIQVIQFGLKGWMGRPDSWMGCRDSVRRHSVVARRNRNSKRRTVRQANPTNRSEQGR
jgi:hypothetical protein